MLFRSPWAERAPDAEEREEMLQMFGTAKRPETPTWDDLLDEVGELLDED